MAEVKYLWCPLCGWRRPIKYGISQKTGMPRDVRFDKIDLEKIEVYQVYELTSEGKGKGKMEKIEGKTIENLPEDLKQQIKNQCKKILEMLGE